MTTIGHVCFSRVLLDKLRACVESYLHKHSGDPSWMKAIPLMHFLDGKTKPYEVPRDTLYSDVHDTAEWWGVHGIEHLVDTFKKKRNTSK